MSDILIIDDDEALCRSLEIQLKGEGHAVRWAGTGAEGLARLARGAPDLLLLDLKLPDQGGLDVLRAVQETHGDLPVVVITGRQDMKATIEAMRGGAFDYVRKPFNFEDVLLLIEKARQLRARREPARAPLAVEEVSPEPYELVGADKKIVEVVKQIGLLSRSRITVLIEGESGTGKELVARALHEATCPGQPFVAINCSAVVATLLESELFGHEKGAFTGAGERKLGKLEFAGEGTVFLDEIGDMSLDLQAKLLRVLEQRELERVGGVKSVPFRARVVAATHRDLARMAEEEKFRRDLYYRLAVTRIALPPLRERREDIALLARHLMGRLAVRLHRRIEGIEESAIRRLERYDWPGNVRELQNALARAVALARGPVIAADDLEFSLRAPQPEEAANESAIVPLAEAEKAHIRKALAAAGWNITQTARVLKISPTTLRKKISDYGLREEP